MHLRRLLLRAVPRLNQLESRLDQHFVLVRPLLLLRFRRRQLLCDLPHPRFQIPIHPVDARKRRLRTPAPLHQPGQFRGKLRRLLLRQIAARPQIPNRKLQRLDSRLNAPMFALQPH